MIAPVQRSKPDEWMEQHGETLYRYARSRLNDHAAVEDVVQDTLVAAFKAHTTFSGRSTEQTWLIGILRHKIIDHVRRDSRCQVVDDPQLVRTSRETVLDRKGHWRVEPSEWVVHPRKAFEHREFMELLEQCLARLDQRFRTVFVMRELEGREVKEICAHLDITPNNFSVILHRAKAKLKNLLTEAGCGMPLPAS